jgi:hypothetical protein
VEGTGPVRVRSLVPGLSDDQNLSSADTADFGPSGRTVLTDNTSSGRPGHRMVRLWDVRWTS